jgi:hypothetical protein
MSSTIHSVDLAMAFYLWRLVRGMDPDPDPHQNIMDLENMFEAESAFNCFIFLACWE